MTTYYIREVVYYEVEAEDEEDAETILTEAEDMNIYSHSIAEREVSTEAPTH